MKNVTTSVDLGSQLESAEVASTLFPSGEAPSGHEP